MAHFKGTFTINTFGYGHNVCPKMMDSIAHFKNGNFYYLRDFSQFDDYLISALGRLFSYSSKNLTINSKFNGGLLN